MSDIDRLREIIERVEETTEPHPDMIAVPLDVLRGVLEYVKAQEAIMRGEIKYVKALEAIIERSSLLNR